MMNWERDEFLKKLETKNDAELNILFDILNNHTNSRDCYNRGYELNEYFGPDAYDDEELYYGIWEYGTLKFEPFTGVWDETGDTYQYLAAECKLPDIVEEFEKKKKQCENTDAIVDYNLLCIGFDGWNDTYEVLGEIHTNNYQRVLKWFDKTFECYQHDYSLTYIDDESGLEAKLYDDYMETCDDITWDAEKGRLFLKPGLRSGVRK